MTSVFGDYGVSRELAASISYPATRLRSGQRIGLPLPLGTFFIANAVAADTMYAWPIPVPASGSLSGMALQVGTAVAGVSGKLGLAAPGADGFPATLLAEAPTPVDMNSVADSELVATFSAAIPRAPGSVWGLCVFNGAAQPVTVGPYTLPGGFVGHMVGATSIGSYTGRGSAGAPARLSRAQTYASAFPASLSGWSVNVVSTPSSPVMVAVVA